MNRKTRVSLTTLAIVLASTSALVAVSDVAAARGSGHANHTRLLPGSAGNNTIRPIVTSQRHLHSRTLANRKRMEKHAKKAVECIKAPCSLDGSDGHTKHGHMQSGSGSTGKPAGTSVAGKPAAPPGTAGNNTIHPIVTPTGGLHPANGDVTVSNGVTATILHGASAGVVVQSLEPGKITVRADNGQSVTLSGGSVNVSGAAIVSPGFAIGDRADHPNGDVTLAIRRGVTYANPATPAPAPAPAPTPVPSHVTGGPEGGFFGALGSSIVDAGKAVGRGAEDVLSAGSPKAGTPGAGASPAKTSTTTQQ